MKGYLPTRAALLATVLLSLPPSLFTAAETCHAGALRIDNRDGDLPASDLMILVQRGRVFTRPIEPLRPPHTPVFPDTPVFPKIPEFNPAFREFKPVFPDLPADRLYPNIRDPLTVKPVIPDGLQPLVKRLLEGAKRELDAEKVMTEGLQINESQYRVAESDVRVWEDSVRSRRPPAAFIIRRITPTSGSGKPVYLLITGEEAPQAFIGNHELRELVEEATDHWTGAGGEPPPRLAMAGDGEFQDFDAALLTMRLSDERLTGRTDFNSLDPPAEFENLPGFGGRIKGVHADGASIVKSGDRYIGTAEYDGGRLTIVGRTREAVAVVMAAIRDIIRDFLSARGLRSFSDLSTAQRLELTQRMKAQSEIALRKIYLEEPQTKEDDGTITVETTLGDETISWSVATLDAPFLRRLARAAP